jgi:hypothetical protein
VAFALVPSFVAAAKVVSAPNPATGSVFGLAWFHKPPEDGSSAQVIASEHRYVHLTGPSDALFREQLRSAGYTLPIYTYVSSQAVEGPGPYMDSTASCAAGYVPYDNNFAWNAGDFCLYIHPNESWFLHNGAGQRVVIDYFGTARYTYLMDPASAGWRAFSYARAQQIRDEWGYDGIWLDNLDLDLDRAYNDGMNSDGMVAEYATQAAWQTAMQGWLSGLRASLGQFPLWANIVGGGLAVTSWDSYAPYLDGAMDESFGVNWLYGWRDPEEWRSQVARAEQWLGAGKGLVMVGQGSMTDTARMNFTLASYMLVAQPDRAFFRYSRFDTYYGSLWLFPEYDTARALGAPLGPRVELGLGMWKRLFTNGYVEVDVSAHTGRLVLINSLTPTSTPTPATCTTTFTDVPPGNAFYSHIEWMACHAYVSGYGCGGPEEPCPGSYFRPGVAVTRGQLLKMLVKAAGWEEVRPQTPSFADVPEDSAFYTYIETGASRGIISGYGCGGPGEPCDSTGRPYFHPGHNITRGQLSKVIALAREYSSPIGGGPSFADVPSGSLFYGYVEAVYAQGIVAGYACGGPGEPCDDKARPYFRPSGNATRGQVSKFVAEAYMRP